jgi:hypothetical protein
LREINIDLNMLSDDILKAVYSSSKVNIVRNRKYINIYVVGDFYDLEIDHRICNKSEEFEYKDFLLNTIKKINKLIIDNIIDIMYFKEIEKESVIIEEIEDIYSQVKH